MKILFVADVSIHATLSGAERVLYEQSTRLAAHEHRADIITRRLEAHDSDQALIRNVREWRYEIDRRSPVSFFASTLKNGRILFENLHGAYNYDCLNFHQPFSAYAVCRSVASHKIRKVYTCHSLSFEEFASRNAMPLSPAGKIMHLMHIFVRKWIEKQALKASDAIIVLSSYTREKLIRHHGISTERIVVIPGGIDLERFHPPQDKDAIRKKLRLPHNKFLLLTIRDLEPRMGIQNLIQAMPAVIGAYPKLEIELIIGGTGPLQDELMAMSNRLHLDNHIRFAGFIPEEDLPGYYQAADFFILPTVDLEGFGLVTVEALASGTPVFGTPVGGTLEILGKLDTSFLFDDTSPEAISRLIIDKCRDQSLHPESRHREMRRCREFAENLYSWEKNIAATLKVFSASHNAHARVD